MNQYVLGVRTEMPIFVQWKWKERTKSFLVIFHFHDDYSKPNIRFKKKKFKDESLEFERPTITWAPSHPELGLLSELLTYANIINGLKEMEKRELRRDLEIVVDEGNGKLRLYWAPIENLLQQLPNKGLLFEAPPFAIFFSHYNVEAYDKKKIDKDSLFCTELCPEYIDYLKTLLKPYFKG